MNKRYAENLELLKSPEVQAMLYTIAKSEGTLDANGNIEFGRIVKGTVISSPYNKSLVGKKNVVITDFSRHPQIMVRVNSKGLKSSAAGFAQFLSKTWANLVKTLDLKDFSPLSQQIAAIELLRQRKAINFVLKGNLKGAFTGSTLGLEWASFPNNNYGQGSHSAEKLQNWFNDAVKKIKGGADLIGDNPAIVGGLSVGLIVAAFIGIIIWKS